MAMVPTAADSAPMWVGHIVCVGLKDGRYYYGRVLGVQNGELVLAGLQGEGKRKSKPRKKDMAQISGMFGSLLGGLGGLGSAVGGLGGLGSLVGGAGAGALGGTGLAGVVGTIGKAWPMIRMGLGALKFIVPIFAKFYR